MIPVPVTQDPAKGAPDTPLIVDRAIDPVYHSDYLINFTRKIQGTVKEGSIWVGDSLQKEELLHLHMLMVHIRKYYECVTGEEIRTERYNSLAISPVHIHRDKKTHKEAILTLGEEIVAHIRHRPPRVPNYSPATASQKVAAEH